MSHNDPENCADCDDWEGTIENGNKKDESTTNRFHI